MADAALKPMTREEFLAWDERQPDRYEFIGGQIYAMTGGTRDHEVIARNLPGALERRLKDTRCQVFGSGLKVEIGDNFLYPDATVTCEPMGRKEQFIRQARAIVEVLSPSTTARDRGEKWMLYQSLRSLEYYLILSQDEPIAELFARGERAWSYQRFIGMDTRVAFGTLGIELALAEIYAGALQDDPGAERAG
jgi:Uma2 family endonuclease